MLWKGRLKNLGVSRNTQQHKNTFSASREKVQSLICYNERLSNKDVRLALALLTILDGYDLQPTENENLDDKRLAVRTQNDPRVFKHIDFSILARCLSWDKKDVKKCMKHLLKEEIIEEDESTSSGIKNGYRFTF
jgi:hypothetical protein